MNGSTAKHVVRALGAAAAFALAAAAAAADALPRNWPLPPAELERRFERAPFVITRVEDAGTGRTGALKLTLAFEDRKVVTAKWKPVPGESLDDWNNSPRRELAAYRIQRFFLDENDYVVPTSAMRCLPLDQYASIRAGAEPVPELGRCVLGVLSVWLKDVVAPYPFFDEARFAGDAAYARGMADFNLLTYLIDHRDGAERNLLLSSSRTDPRPFSIDNGISFQSFPWNMSVLNWNEIRVPWLRRQSVDRLRTVREEDLASLGVVAQLEKDVAGIYRVVPAGENLSRGRGVRKEDGVIQLGLSGREIDRVRGRIVKLLRKVDSGEIAVR